MGGPEDMGLGLQPHPQPRTLTMGALGVVAGVRMGLKVGLDTGEAEGVEVATAEEVAVGDMVGK